MGEALLAMDKSSLVGMRERTPLIRTPARLTITQCFRLVPYKLERLTSL